MACAKIADATPLNSIIPANCGEHKTKAGSLPVIIDTAADKLI
jgi:hypothetical protein